VSAELGALELARATAPASTPVDPHYAPVVTAGQYFAAIEALDSSPADPPARILTRPEDARVGADAVLARALDIQATPGPQSAGATAVAPTIEGVAGGTTSLRGACIAFHSRGSGAALDLSLPSGGLELRAAPGPPVEVRARRFASLFDGAPLATLVGGATIVVKSAADGSALPWHIRLSPMQPVLACGL
jgi:hypothetical protein